MRFAGNVVSGLAALALMGCASSLPPLPPGEVMQTVTASALPPPPTEAEIAALVAKSKALGPEDKARAQTLFSTGFQLWQAGDFKAAEIAFSDGLAIDPADASANFYYGDALRRVKGRASAAQFLQNLQIAADLGGGSAEGLKARVALEDLAVPPAKLSEMTEAERVNALVGVWRISNGLGTNPPFDARISSIRNGRITAQAQFGVWNLSEAKIDGDEVQLTFNGLMGGRATFHLVHVSDGVMDGRVDYHVGDGPNSSPTSARRR